MQNIRLCLVLLFLTSLLFGSCVDDPKSWPPPEKEVFQKVFSHIKPGMYEGEALGARERAGGFFYTLKEGGWIQLSSMDPDGFECLNDPTCNGKERFIRKRLTEIKNADVILVDGKYDGVYVYTRIKKRGLRYVLLYNPDFSKEEVKGHFAFKGGQIGEYGNGWFSFLSDGYKGSF